MNVSISSALILEQQKNSIKNMISKFKIYYKSNAYQKDSNSCSISYCVSIFAASSNKMSFDYNNIGANILLTKHFKHLMNFRT